MVLPSMRECGGAVVLEAMASGVPVIATKWGGPVDYLNEDTGILVPPGTPDTFVRDLADAISFVANNHDERVKMGQAGRARVRELYDWRVKAINLLKIYEEVVRQDQARELAAMTATYATGSTDPNTPEKGADFRPFIWVGDRACDNLSCSHLL